MGACDCAHVAYLCVPHLQQGCQTTANRIRTVTAPPAPLAPPHRTHVDNDMSLVSEVVIGCLPPILRMYVSRDTMISLAAVHEFMTNESDELRLILELPVYRTHGRERDA